jgi:hypothetical protein
MKIFVSWSGERIKQFIEVCWGPSARPSSAPLAAAGAAQYEALAVAGRYLRRRPVGAGGCQGGGVVQQLRQGWIGSQGVRLGIKLARARGELRQIQAALGSAAPTGPLNGFVSGCKKNAVITLASSHCAARSLTPAAHHLAENQPHAVLAGKLNRQAAEWRRYVDFWAGRLRSQIAISKPPTQWRQARSRLKLREPGSPAHYLRPTSAQ